MSLLASRRFSVAGAVILVDRKTYEILLLKRSPKISFGGYFAFPGGVIEPQDHPEHWMEQNPEAMHHMNSLRREDRTAYFDLEKRICALRETFEETNLLLQEGQQ